MIWHQEPFAALDFEATTNDPFTGRPVSFAFVIVNARGDIEASLSEVINSGVPSTPEAVAVHGITDEMALAGVNPGWATAKIAECLNDARREKLPLCIMNARFDWTLLLEEGTRHNVEIPTGVALLDPGLLDKGVDRYRKGKRKLTDLCLHYGVVLTDAHQATADAVAAARVSRAVIERHLRLRVADPLMLAHWQGVVFEEYRRFLCSDGSKTISKGWPVPDRPA